MNGPAIACTCTALLALTASLCANMNETASITPVHCEGDEVNHHDCDGIEPRSSHEQR